MRRSKFLEAIAPFGDLNGKTLLNAPSDGGYLRSYLPPTVRYIALDQGVDFAKSARQRMTSRDVMLRAEPNQIPLADATVDAICNIAGMHHTPYRMPCYQEFRRILAREGHLVLADVHEGSREDYFLDTVINRLNPLGHRGRFLNEHDTEALTNVGFVLVSTMMTRYYCEFTDVTHAIRFCGQLFGVDEPSNQEELGKVLLTEMGLHAHPDRDECWRLPWSLRRVVCRPTV